MNEIIVTVTDKKHSYSETIVGQDYDDLLNLFTECQSNGANPDLEKITFKEYTRNISFNWDDENMYKLNGNHFIFGWLECLEQSDNTAGWMYEPETKLFVSVTNRELIEL